MPKVDSYAAATALQNDELFFIKQTSTKKATSAQVRTLPIVATYGALPSVGVVDGQEALVNRLVGSGYFRVRYNTATTRWAVVMGEVIAVQNDPYSYTNPGSTANIDNTWCTLPAGIHGDGEEWEIEYPFETGTNTGSDVILPIIGGSGTQPSTVGSAAYAANVMRLTRYGTSIKRTFSITGTSIAGSISTYAIDMSSARALVIRMTPANGVNTGFNRRLVYRRIS